MSGPYVQYRVLEVTIIVFFFLVTSCEEHLVILNLLNPLAAVRAKTRRTRLNTALKHCNFLNRTNVALIVSCAESIA